MPSLVSKSSVEDPLRAVCEDACVRWFRIAYFSLRDWKSSLVEAILALISSKRATTAMMVVLVWILVDRCTLLQHNFFHSHDDLVDAVQSVTSHYNC